MPRSIRGGAGFPKFLQTKSIFKNNVNIFSVTVFARGTAIENISWRFTNQGNRTNPTYKEAQYGKEYFFTTTGQDLRLRAIGKTGSKITFLKVVYTTEE